MASRAASFPPQSALRAHEARHARAQEDEKLKRLVEEYGGRSCKKWALIASKLKSKGSKQVGGILSDVGKVWALIASKLKSKGSKLVGGNSGRCVADGRRPHAHTQLVTILRRAVPPAMEELPGG
jgi:hypothetical protein